MVEAAIWNKNGKEKAVPYKFVEKTQELSNFFIEFKSIKDYLSVDKCLKLNACIITQETLFNTLKNEILPTEVNTNVLKKRINFETEEGLNTSGDLQKRREVFNYKPFNFNKNNV